MCDNYKKWVLGTPSDTIMATGKAPGDTFHPTSNNPEYLIIWPQVSSVTKGLPSAVGLARALTCLPYW